MWKRPCPDISSVYDLQGKINIVSGAEHLVDSVFETYECMHLFFLAEMGLNLRKYNYQAVCQYGQEYLNKKFKKKSF